MVGTDVYRLGLWSARLVMVWVVAFLLSLLVGVVFGITTLPFSFFVCLLLAPSFLVMMMSIHYQVQAEKRIWSALAVAFAVIYAVLVGIVYYVQLTAARGVTGGALLPFVYTPGTVFFALDILGYAFMSLSTWFAAPAFTGSDGLSTWIRRLAIIHGWMAAGLLMPAFLPTATAAGSDSSAGVLVMFVWAAVFLPFTFLLMRHFERQLAQSRGRSAATA